MPEAQDYYGTKRVMAWPQDKDDTRPGYTVRYADGYTSWSPKDVFEAAYQPLTALSFGHALEALKAGQRVARSGWNGKGMWLALQVPDAQSKMSLPYIYMRTVQGDLVPWLASQTDMLADDWQIAT
jgi:hypothetical protein